MATCIIDVSELGLPDGKIELASVLGKGNYGSVFKGQLLSTNETIAVKVVKWNPEEGEDILREIEIMMNFVHPNVVFCHGAYYSPQSNQIWIALEYCELGSIGQLIVVQEKGLKEEHISFVCSEILKGLVFLHENSIIHRDVKCDNILITINAEIKLADFGVSTDVSSREGKAYSRIGTPYWMAPEVISCPEDPDNYYDARCDIWSLGVSLIEMAEMDPPLSKYHPMRALHLIVQAPPPTLSNPRKYSKEFNQFLAHCLMKDFSYRSTAKELLKHPFLQAKKSKTFARKQPSFADLLQKVSLTSRENTLFGLQTTRTEEGKVTTNAEKVDSDGLFFADSNTLASLDKFPMFQNPLFERKTVLFTESHSDDEDEAESSKEFATVIEEGSEDHLEEIKEVEEASEKKELEIMVEDPLDEMDTGTVKRREPMESKEKEKTGTVAREKDTGTVKEKTVQIKGVQIKEFADGQEQQFEESVNVDVNVNTNGNGNGSESESGEKMEENDGEKTPKEEDEGPPTLRRLQKTNSVDSRHRTATRHPSNSPSRQLSVKKRDTTKRLINESLAFRRESRSSIEGMYVQSIHSRRFSRSSFETVPLTPSSLRPTKDTYNDDDWSRYSDATIPSENGTMNSERSRTSHGRSYSYALSISSMKTGTTVRASAMSVEESIKESVRSKLREQNNTDSMESDYINIPNFDNVAIPDHLLSRQASSSGLIAPPDSARPSQSGNPPSGLVKSVSMTSLAGNSLFTATSTFHFSESQKGVLRKLKQNLLMEVICIDVIGNQCLIGNSSGLFLLDELGKVITIVEGKTFHQVKIIIELGIFLAIAGKKMEIKMYSLIELSRVVKSGVSKPKEFPVHKMTDTVGSKHFSILFLNGNWFLSVCLKKSVVLYMWANFPHYKFMIVKEWKWAFKEKPLLSRMITRPIPPDELEDLIMGDRVDKSKPQSYLSHLCVQDSNRHVVIDIATNRFQTLHYDVQKRDLPVQVVHSPDRLFFAFSDSGFFLDVQTFQRLDPQFEWDVSPQHLVVIKDLIICFGPKSLVICDRNLTPLNHPTIKEDFKKVTFLASDNEMIYFAAKLGNDSNAIYSFEL